MARQRRPGLYKTGTVARRVGMSSALLRMWETRYGFPEPNRTTTGQRLYTDDDVAVLAAVRTLQDRGYSIGELSQWPRRELLDAARQSQLASPGGASAAPAASAPECILALEDEGVIALASPEIELILGWSPELLRGQPIWGLFVSPPEPVVRAVTRTSVDSASDVAPMWTFMRSRGGALVACAVSAGKRRRVQEGTRITLSVRRLESAAEGLVGAIDAAAEVAERALGSDIDERGRQFATKCVEQLDAAFSRVWLADRDPSRLRLAASAGLSTAVATSQRASIQISRYPFKVGVVARTGVPFVHNGLVGDKDFERGWARRERLEAAAVYPIMKGGALRGVTATFFRRRLEAVDLGRVSAWLAALR